jgi:cytochrome c553
MIRACVLAVCAAIALISAMQSTHAADESLPDWARPTPGPAQPAPPAAAEDNTPRTIPGSTVQYTAKQIEDSHIAKDWFPNTHPAMPAIVAGAEGAPIQACAACHLPTGMGHPESASIAGLPANYTARAIAAMANGSRVPIGSMARIAKALSPSEIQQSAAYFAALKPVSWVHVVESATAPQTYTIGTERLPLPDASPEPLGHRIIELPQNVAAFHEHDPRSGFIAYVPVGSIAAGRALVQGGSGTMTCAICHGTGLRGSGETPRLVAGGPTYLYRQLWDFKHGTRNDAAAAPMKAVVQHLTDDQMIGIAAYLGSLGEADRNSVSPK